MLISASPWYKSLRELEPQRPRSKINQSDSARSAPVKNDRMKHTVQFANFYRLPLDA